MDVNSLNVNDVKVLVSILDKETGGGLTKVKGATIRDLTNRTGFSHTTVRQSISRFLDDSVVAEGLKRGNARTFYVNEKGLELMKELKK